MSTTENVVKAILTAEDRGYFSAMGKAAEAADRLSGCTSGLAKASAAFAIGQRVVNGAVNAVTSSVGRAISRYDELNKFPKTMANLKIGPEESKKALDDLVKGLEGVPTALDDATRGVTRLVSSNKDIDKSTKYFLAMNDAIIAGGGNAGMQASAIEQLTQAYSKGKMDMIEWRSIMQAMPAQIDQIAGAMGMSSDALGEGLRTGTISMDNFMDTIVELDQNGANGFASFAQQAKDASGGIQTAMTNFRTYVAKGVAGCIESFDKLLSSNGLPKIGEAINIASTYVQKAFSVIQKYIERIDLKGVIATATPIWNMFKKAATSVGTVLGKVAGFVLDNLGLFSKLAIVVSAAVTAFRTKSAISEFCQGIDKTSAAYLKVSGAATGAIAKVKAFGIAHKKALIGGGIALAAVAGIAAIGVYMAKSGKSADELAAAVETVAGNITKTIKSIVSKIPALLPAVLEAGETLFMGLVDSLGLIVEPMMAAFPSIIEGILTIIPTLIPALLDGIVTIGISLVGGIIKLIPKIQAAIPEIIIAIVKTLIKALPKLLDAGAKLILGLLAGMVATFGAVIAGVWNFAKKIPEKIMGIGKSLYNAGINLIKGLWNGIKAKFDSVVEKVKGLASNLPKAVKKVLGIKSPSRVMFAIGEYFGEGLSNGITSMKREVESAANKIVTVPSLSSPKLSFAGYNGTLDSSNYSYADMNYTFVVETNIDGKKAAETIVPHATPIIERNQLRADRSRGLR